LDFVSNLFAGLTGGPFEDATLKALVSEGDVRYQNETPPGYKDGKKDGSGDPYRKFGDLIIWKQLLAKAKEVSKPVIFISDDKKEDWWLEQSGRTIGPRTELREEFIRETSQDFWMYSVDRFVEEAAQSNNIQVSKAVIDEIVAVSEDARAEPSPEPVQSSQARAKIVHPVLTEEEIFAELVEFLDSYPSDDGSVGLRYFVANYLGSQDYEINHSYARLNSLAAAGRVDIYKREKNGAVSTRVRILNNG
jgi:hypothetical protein